jgi:RHS repeat-associated protein
MRVGTADPYYILTDHLGSTTVTTDAGGNAVGELKYAPWGEVRSGTAPTSYTFTGQYSNVNDFGLMFYNARWYDVGLGRMAQADSIVPGGAQGWDRYAYVGNNPVRFSDPTGHKKACGVLSGGCEDRGPDTENPFEELGLVDRDGRDSPAPPPPDLYLAGCTSETPCLSNGSIPALPPTAYFHPFDSNVMLSTPMFDFSTYPPKVVGETITSYAYESADFDLLSFAVRVAVPLPNLSRPGSAENADFLYAVGEQLARGPAKSLETFDIVIRCPVCTGIRRSLKALAVAEALNESTVLLGRLRTHDLYYTEPPLRTPFDSFP